MIKIVNFKFKWKKTYTSFFQIITFFQYFLTITIIIAIKMLATNWLPLQTNFQLRLRSRVLQPFSTAVPSDKPTTTYYVCVSMVLCLVPCDCSSSGCGQIFGNFINFLITCRWQYVVLYKEQTAKGERERGSASETCNGIKHEAPFWNDGGNIFALSVCQKLYEVEIKAVQSYEQRKEWKKLWIKEIRSGNMAAFMRLEES